MVNQYTRRSVIITFIIGFVAGATPFVFMKLLPMMLHPELYTIEANQLAILLSGVILTGCIVGVITSLVFGSEFEQKDPKEVFVYALGIPAILISTVSGLMTDFNAVQKISAVQASASAALLAATPSAQNIPEVQASPVNGPIPAGGPQSRLFFGTAWAAEEPLYLAAASSKKRYLVAIGVYADEPEAREALNLFQHRKFKAEAYLSKNLGLLKLDGKSARFIVIFNSYDNAVKAQRAYQLLKINDPDLAVSLLQTTSK